jgi:hypothetical protein
MTKTKLATLFLIIGMFLNPLGFDAIQLMLIHLTGSLLKANFVLYFLAVFCFGLYFYFSGNNPFLMIRDIIVSIYQDRIAHNFKKFKKNKTH